MIPHFRSRASCACTLRPEFRLNPVTLVRTSIASFPGNSLVGITVVRDWATPARRSSWGSLKQLYR